MRGLQFQGFTISSLQFLGLQFGQFTIFEGFYNFYCTWSQSVFVLKFLAIYFWGLSKAPKYLQVQTAFAAIQFQSISVDSYIYYID